jgi:hypothetical protein
MNRLCAGLFSVIVCTGAAAQAYKCTDAKGAVRYQQSPCSASKQDDKVRLTYESHSDDAAAATLPPEVQQRFAALVGQGRVAVGMSAGMVRRAWGPPERVNSSIRAGSRSEQWVYKNENVYLENGFVSSIQTSR